MPKKLSGAKLAGGNPKGERVAHDHYTTDPAAVEKLLDEYPFREGTFLEPCVGNGNIVDVVKKRFPKSSITFTTKPLLIEQIAK